jgi:hypothetical protein
MKFASLVLDIIASNVRIYCTGTSLAAFLDLGFCRDGYGNCERVTMLQARYFLFFLKAVFGTFASS